MPLLVEKTKFHQHDGLLLQKGLLCEEQTTTDTTMEFRTKQKVVLVECPCRLHLSCNMALVCPCRPHTSHAYCTECVIRGKARQGPCRIEQTNVPDKGTAHASAWQNTEATHLVSLYTGEEPQVYDVQHMKRVSKSIGVFAFWLFIRNRNLNLVVVVHKNPTNAHTSVLPLLYNLSSRECALPYISCAF